MGRDCSVDLERELERGASILTRYLWWCSLPHGMEKRGDLEAQGLARFYGDLVQGEAGGGMGCRRL